VQAAFALEAAKARILFLHTVEQFTRAVPVADRDIAFLPERMIGQFVRREILVHAPIVPIDDGMNFGDFVLLLNGFHCLARAGL